MTVAIPATVFDIGNNRRVYNDDSLALQIVQPGNDQVRPITNEC